MELRQTFQMTKSRGEPPLLGGFSYLQRYCGNSQSFYITFWQHEPNSSTLLEQVGSKKASEYVADKKKKTGVKEN